MLDRYSALKSINSLFDFPVFRPQKMRSLFHQFDLPQDSYVCQGDNLDLHNPFYLRAENTFLSFSFNKSEILETLSATSY